MNLPLTSAVILGHELRQARRHRRLTQKVTAQMADIDLVTLQNLEGGRGTVTPLISLLKALDYRFNAQPDDKGLGQWLRGQRESLKLSQHCLSEGADVSKPTIIKLERGQGHIDSLTRVMTALGLSVHLRPKEIITTLAPVGRHLDVRTGDCLVELQSFKENTFDCCVTSPPYYGHRDYNVAGQIGLEESSSEYIQKIVQVFREVRRVLKQNGSLWLVIADTYARKDYKDIGLKKSDLMGIPWKVALALQADGWFLRQDVIWSKPNPVCEPATNRCARSHEYIFLLAKSAKYRFDATAIRERGVTTNPGSAQRNTKETHGGVSGGNTGINAAKEKMKKELAEKGYVTRNKRSVWTVKTKPSKYSHFATYPTELIEPCILAGSPVNGHVLDPFGGSGTTGVAALNLGRRATLIEINTSYVETIRKRCEAIGIA